MVTVDTKQMRNGQWSSYTTFKGYDEQFFGRNHMDAQDRMAAHLNKFGIQLEDIRFTTPIKYIPDVKAADPVDGYRKSRIDNNPIA